jgi:hypothetical protein
MATTLKDYSAQVQDPLRQGLVDVLWQSSRLFSRLNFIKHNGITYPYSKRTKRPGVATRSFNADFTIQQGNYAPDVETMAILGGTVKTDTMMQLVKPNLRQNEIAGTMESAGLMCDRLFIKGDPTKPGAVNEFYGLYPRISGTQLINMGTNGGVVTHEKVSELLDLVSGPNSEKKLIMPRKARRDLSEDVKADAGGKGVFDVGKQLTSFDNAEIWEAEKDENDNEIMPYTETKGSSTDCTSILCIRPGGSIDERDVQGLLSADLMFTPTGQRGVFLEDVIQMFGGIGVFGGFSIARLEGVRAA